MSVPALLRGLKIIEMAVQQQGIRFGDVQKAFNIPKASAARLLNQLVDLSYLSKEKDTGLYKAGPRFLELVPYVPLPDRLYRSAQPLLKGIVEATGNTVILVYWDGRHTQILAKEAHPESVVMQEVGSIRDDLLFYPWGWLFYNTLDCKKKQTITNTLKQQTSILKSAEKGLLHYKKNGYVLEKKAYRGGLPRLAAPIRLQGLLVGALGMGCVNPEPENSKIDTWGRKLAVTAGGISQLLERAHL